MTNTDTTPGAADALIEDAVHQALRITNAYVEGRNAALAVGRDAEGAHKAGIDGAANVIAALPAPEAVALEDVLSEWTVRTMFRGSSGQIVVSVQPRIGVNQYIGTGSTVDVAIRAAVRAAQGDEQ